MHIRASVLEGLRQHSGFWGRGCNMSTTPKWGTEATLHYSYRGIQCNFFPCKKTYFSFFKLIGHSLFFPLLMFFGIFCRCIYFFLPFSKLSIFFKLIFTSKVSLRTLGSFVVFWWDKFKKIMFKLMFTL